MENYLRTGRPLQIEELANAKNKVTLGFKCDAGTKIQLAAEAQQNGMTLSEYVDTLVHLRHEASARKEQVADANNGRILDLQERLHFYEKNSTLLGLLESNRGKLVTLEDGKGKSRSMKIQSIRDVFTAMIHSFKYNKP